MTRKIALQVAFTEPSTRPHSEVAARQEGMTMRHLLLFVGPFVCALVVGAGTASAEPRCLHRVSKNFCTAEFASGQWSPEQCPNSDCKIWDGKGASLTIPLVNGDPTCDKAPDVGDTIKIIQVTGRIQRRYPLPGSGYIEGTAQLFSGGSHVGTARLWTTTGAGTHREVACQGKACSPKCENCQDVQAEGSVWKIGTEGTLWGETTAAPGSYKYKQCRIRWSLQGHYTAAAAPSTGKADAGPMPPDSGWQLCGTIEGVMDCPCP